MDLGKLFDQINYILNRDQLGSPASPDAFNMLLKFHNREFYDNSYKELVKMLMEQGRAVMDAYFQSTSPLKRFYKQKDYNFTTPAAPVLVPVPTDYARVLTLSVFSKDNWREVDLIGELEFTNRTQNIFIKDPEEFPFGMEYYDHVFDLDLGAVTRTVFKVIPLRLRKYRLAYLFNVIEPYFDYCVDEQDNIVYMPPTSIIMAKQGPTVDASLIMPDGTHLADHVTKREGATAYPYTSQSIELDWNEEHKDYFLDAIIRDASLRARENITPNPTKQ
jgi:hypothetical protein